MVHRDIHSAWIGYTDVGQNSWYWIDSEESSGDPTNFERWASSQPDNNDGNSHCAIISTGMPTFGPKKFLKVQIRNLLLLLKSFNFTLNLPKKNRNKSLGKA